MKDGRSLLHIILKPVNTSSRSLPVPLFADENVLSSSEEQGKCESGIRDETVGSEMLMQPPNGM
jgi:hypothetical protein